MTDNEPPDYTLPDDPIIPDEPLFWLAIQVRPENANVLHMDLVDETDTDTVLNEVNVPPGSQANVQLPAGKCLILSRGDKVDTGSQVLRPAGMTPGGLILPGR